MKNTSAALVAAFLLLLTACGSANTPNLEASAGASSGADPSVGDDGAAGDGGQVGPADTETDRSTEPDDQPDAIGDTGTADAGTEGAGVAESSVPGSTATLQTALRTAGDPAAVTSARFETSVTMTGAAGSEMPGEFTIAMTGAYDLIADANQVAMDMSGLADLADLAGAEGAGDDEFAFMTAFFEDDIEMISIGETAWVRWSLLTMFTGADDKWLEGDAGDAGELTSDFGVDGAPMPTDIFDLLADANVEVEEVGVEAIRGVATTHYRFTADLEALSEATSDAEWEEIETTMGAAPIGDLPMDLWLDDEGRLHRFVIEMTDLDTMTGDQELAGLRIVFELWDHGADVGITPPPADQIITEDELSFGFGFTDEGIDLEG